MQPHPALVHLPIAFALFGPALGLGLFLLGRRLGELRRAWLLTVLWHFLMSATIYAALFTGEAAKENAPDRLQTAIEAHEERAELFFLLSLAAIPLAVWGAKARGEGPRIALIVYQLLLLGVCVYVGYLGGRITHAVTG